MAKHTPIHLASEERDQLLRLISAGHAPARVQTRARILLLTDHSQQAHRTNVEIAQALLCAPATVFNVCRRYRQEGLDAALTEKARPGNPRKLDGQQEARLVVLACSNPPEGQARWTLRLLADKAVELGIVDALSHTTVAETLKKMRSSPGAYKPGALANRARST